MMRRRRPIMRGAMVGGVGYVAGKAGARRAAQEASREQPGESSQAPASAPPAAGGTVVEQLKQLGELRDSGVLTPEEFEREKQKILAAS